MGREIIGGYALVAKAKLLKLISVSFHYFEFLSSQGRIFAGDTLWVKKTKTKNNHVSESDRPGNSDWIPRDS